MKVGTQQDERTINVRPSKIQSRLGIDNGVRVQKAGLRVTSEISLETWKRVGEQLEVVSNSSLWWLADWLIYGENHFPDRYRQVIRQTSLDYQTLRNYAWVARRFPLSRRRDTLSFSHHMEIAALPESDRDVWLDRASEHGWSRNELRRQIRCAGSSAAKPLANSAAMTVKPTREQEERWRRAATHANLRIETWVMSALDKAADADLSMESTVDCA